MTMGDNESYGDKQGKEKKKKKAVYGWKICNRERINFALFPVHLSVDHVSQLLLVSCGKQSASCLSFFQEMKQ